MKKVKSVFVFLGLIFLVSLLGGVNLVSATVGLTCSSDQTLFRLYQESNSHVANYSDTRYPVQVCYNNVFGFNFTEANPHSCKPGNTNALFWINSSINSHISATATDVYSIPVCYGDLSCRFAESCLASEVSVLKAYSLENSHVSLNPSDYDYDLCCKNGLALKDAYWSNLLGQEVEGVELGDSVLMVAKGLDFDETQTHNFSISGNSNLNLAGKLWSAVTLRGWDPQVSWVMNSINWWKTSLVGSYKFTVKVVGKEVSFTSNDLNITKDSINTLPFVRITSEKKMNTSIGTPLIFNSSIYDEDDFLTVSWNFGDGSNRTIINNYALATSENPYVSTTHSFNIPGNYIVRLTAIEKERKQAKSDFVQVLVFGEGINVIPVISSPVYGVNDYGSLIWFDARQSFVANCSSTLWRNAGEYNLSVGDLHCKYIHAPGQESLGNYNLTASWFIDNVQASELSGEWGSEVSTGKVQHFLEYFPEPSLHTAELILTYSSS